MGLMCKYACEECEFLVFDHECCQEVQLQPGTILDNMDFVLNADISSRVCSFTTGSSYDVFSSKPKDNSPKPV